MTTALGKAIIKQCDDVSAIMKSLSHPVRLKILCLLLERERSVNDLTETCEVSQSAMSQLLQRMKDEGVVASRREHNFVYYSIADEKLIKLLRAVREIYC